MENNDYKVSDIGLAEWGNKEISIVHIRGNVDTRIKMLEKGNLDGIILAAAGIKCLNMNNHIGLIFESEEICRPSAKELLPLNAEKMI